LLFLLCPALLFPQVWICRLHRKRFLFVILQKFLKLALLLCGGQGLEFLVLWAMLKVEILVLV
jgi:hypothetical protein